MVRKEHIKMVDSMVRDTLVKKVFAFRPVGGVKLKKDMVCLESCTRFDKRPVVAGLKMSARGI